MDPHAGHERGRMLSDDDQREGEQVSDNQHRAAGQLWHNYSRIPLPPSADEGEQKTRPGLAPITFPCQDGRSEWSMAYLPINAKT
jgi:hypothetical protein